MKILIATGNQHKFKELSAILPSTLKNGSKITYLNLKDFDLSLPEETGITLEENAQIKAIFAARKTGVITLSDDTGLEVDVLNGAPGVYTARYAGENATALDNNKKLLQALSGYTPEQRTARFRTIACLAYPDGKFHCFEGKAEGQIALDYEGTNGFGYDPIFIEATTHKTFATLTEEEKNSLSHRAKAFAKVIQFLEEL